MTNWKLVPVEPTETQRQSMYMAQHYDMSVINPDEWGAVDKSYAAAVTNAPDPTDDAELVERVARAIYASAHGPREWEAAHTTLHSLYLRDARAALKAIQEGR